MSSKVVLIFFSVSTQMKLWLLFSGMYMRSDDGLGKDLGAATKKGRDF